MTAPGRESGRRGRPIPLAALAMLNLAVGFAFQWYVIAELGAGLVTDALFVAMIVPQLVLAVAIAGLSATLVPLFSARGQERNQEAWTVLHAVAGAAAVLAALLFATAGWWIPILAPGFEPASTTLAARLVRIQLVSVPFAAAATVLWAVGYARGRFVWAESGQLVSAALALVAIVWILPRYGIVGAAWVIAGRAVVHAAVLVPLAGPYRTPVRGSGVLAESWRRLKPLLLGTSYYKSDELVDRVLASMAPAGALTLLYLAQRLWTAFQAVLSKSLVGPLAPELSRVAQAGDWPRFRRLVLRRLLLLSGILALATLALLGAGEWALSLLFGQTRVGPAEVRTLWWLLVALTGMGAAGVVGELLAVGFYAQGETLLPTRIGVAGFTIGIAFKVMGFMLWGVLGIAVGTSAYYLLNMGLLAFYLRRTVGRRPEGTSRVGTA